MILKGKLIIILIIIFAHVFVACNKNMSKIVLKKEKTYYCNIENFDSVKKSLKSFQVIDYEGFATLSYVNLLDSTINFHVFDTVDGSQNHKSYHLNNVIRKHDFDNAHSFSVCLIVNNDSVFILRDNDNYVYLFNVYDKIIDSFPLYNPNSEKNYICYSVDMKYSYPYLILPANQRVLVNNNTSEYYSLNGIILNIKDKTIEKFGRNSQKEILNNIYYIGLYNYFDIQNDKIIFSASEDNNIYEYNIGKDEYKIFNAKSKYIKSVIPIPDSIAFDFSEKYKFKIENPYYRRPVFSVADDYILRVAQIRGKVFEDDGFYKQKKTHQEYSIIVMDKNYKIIDEVLLSPANSDDFILPTKEGIFLINKDFSNFSNDYKLCLDLYRIKKR